MRTFKFQALTPFTGFHSALPPCGPDVTDLIGLVLAQVQSTWDRWSNYQKCVACASLHDPYVCVGAFDIIPLLFIGKNQYPYPSPSKPGGPPNGQPYYYDRTVTFNGHCYQGGAVNYTLWGKINKLCASRNPLTFSKLYADAGVWVWKTLMFNYWGTGWQQAVTQAKAFTDYGYSGTDPSSVALLASINPSNTISTDPFWEPFWIWKPYFVDATPAPSLYSCWYCITHLTIPP